MKEEPEFAQILWHPPKGFPYSERNFSVNILKDGDIIHLSPAETQELRRLLNRTHAAWREEQNG